MFADILSNPLVAIQKILKLLGVNVSQDSYPSMLVGGGDSIDSKCGGRSENGPLHPDGVQAESIPRAP